MFKSYYKTKNRQLEANRTYFEVGCSYKAKYHHWLVAENSCGFYVSEAGASAGSSSFNIKSARQMQHNHQTRQDDYSLISILFKGQTFKVLEEHDNGTAGFYLKVQYENIDMEELSEDETFIGWMRLSESIGDNYNNKHFELCYTVPASVSNQS